MGTIGKPSRRRLSVMKRLRRGAILWGVSVRPRKAQRGDLAETRIITEAVENIPNQGSAQSPAEGSIVDRLIAFGRQTGMLAYARDGVRMYDPFHPFWG